MNSLYLLSDLSSCCMCTCVYMLVFLFAEGWCSGCYLSGLIFLSPLVVMLFIWRCSHAAKSLVLLLGLCYLLFVLLADRDCFVV